MDSMGVFMSFMAILMITIVVGCGYAMVSNLNADTVCAQHGYPTSKLTMGGWYCVRMVNQSSEVIKIPAE